MTAVFEWTSKRGAAAMALAKGATHIEAAAEAGVSERTIRYWLVVPEFAAEVDRLTLMLEIASRAYRLRIANRVIHQFVKQGEPIPTSKDVLDWLKYAQGETDGVKVDVLSMLDALTSQDTDDTA